MIPQNIQKKDILNAINKIEKDGFPPSRESEYYDLIYQQKPYPPKVIISYSNITANRKELSSKLFNGGDEANNFLISLGFPIRVKESRNPEAFFTREELRFFSHVANQDYDSENLVDQNAGEFIRYEIWSKTRRWADQISDQLPFDVEGNQHWNQQSNGKTGQRFKDYTWYRLYHREISNPKVYFTVGVGSDRTLIIKLDCQHTDRGGLSSEIVEKIHSYQDTHGVQWLTFSDADLEDLSWESLITQSIAYINRTLFAYRAMVRLAEGDIPEKFARVCWNDNGWTEPSGKSGKSVTHSSSAPAIQERDRGFGSEEWIFDLDKIIDGYHYSRLEPLRTPLGKHIGNIYNLTLFAFNRVEDRWYWIGRIINAEVITPERSEQISAHYRTEGLFREQVRQLRDLPGVDADFFEQMPDTDRFNVRFQPEDVRIFDYAPFEPNEVPPTGHYNLGERRRDPEFFTNEPENGLDFSATIDLKPKRMIGRRYSEGYREFDNIHGSIQDDLVQVLQSLYPDDDIHPEALKKANRSRVDIVRITPAGEHIFYEIKTYPSVSHSIRVAVGQLLEYAFYPEQELSDNYVIVTHLEATPLELRYLRHLSRRTNCTFEYLHFDWKSKQIIPNAI